MGPRAHQADGNDGSLPFDVHLLEHACLGEQAPDIVIVIEGEILVWISCDVLQQGPCARGNPVAQLIKWLELGCHHESKCHASLTTAGTCPFPRALSCCDLWATP